MKNMKKVKDNRNMGNILSMRTYEILEHKEHIDVIWQRIK